MEKQFAELSTLEKLLMAQAITSKEVLSFNETCLLLDVSASHLYKLTSSRAIPHYCPQNKKLYFKREELIGWMLRNKRETSDEIEQKAANHLIENPLNRRNNE